MSTQDKPLTDNQQDFKPEKQEYEPIENYGIIGNRFTAALVSLKGSIDFLSFTRFDSPTIFASILDVEKGGSFKVNPEMENPHVKQLYVPETNVLVTRFFAEEGIAELIDFMPICAEEHHCSLIRKISTVRGEIKFRVRCAPRFNYGRSSARARKNEGSIVFDPDIDTFTSLVFSSDQELGVDGKDAVSTFTLKETESAFFILETAECAKQRKGSLSKYVGNKYTETIRYWQQWISRCSYKGPWMEVVERSALTLKLLTFYPEGSTVAAATFGLPERIHGTRNWDYRYSWVRDSAFIIYAFLELGFREEAEDYIQWIARQCQDQPLQLVYGVDGSTKLDEYELGHLEGYKESHPVRVGNDAHKQFQLDIYGELLDTVNTYVQHGGEITFEFWEQIRKYIDTVIENWQEKDHSIWEVRGEKREFLFTRVMCWVALDRGIAIGEKKSLPYDFNQWRTVRDTIYADIHENFWNEEMNSFVQSKHSDLVDASSLIMPLVGFISPKSRRWKGTMAAIDKELRSDVLIYRYREKLTNIDGIKGREGTFSICSFWYVECLARSGEIEKAREYFEKMLGYANHLGLYSEQIGMRGEHLGNFPQAFTHLSLVSAVLELSKIV